MEITYPDGGDHHVAVLATSSSRLSYFRIEFYRSQPAFPSYIQPMFSKACEYAIRATVYLAQKTSDEERLGVEAIAEGIDAPKAFVAKILQQLNKASVIRSIKGPSGGFFLTESLKNQPVGNVLVAFAEDERLTNCVMGLHLCNDKKPCPLHLQYKDIKHQLVQLFKEKKIRELADNMKRTRLFIRHQ